MIKKTRRYYFYFLFILFSIFSCSPYVFVNNTGVNIQIIYSAKKTGSSLCSSGNRRRKITLRKAKKLGLHQDCQISKEMKSVCILVNKTIFFLKFSSLSPDGNSLYFISSVREGEDGKEFVEIYFKDFSFKVFSNED